MARTNGGFANGFATVLLALCLVLVTLGFVAALLAPFVLIYVLLMGALGG